MTNCILSSCFSPPLSLAVDCGPLDNPSNGNVVLDDTTLRSEAAYTCHVGHFLVGSDARTCLSNGSWSGSEPFCERKLFQPTFLDSFTYPLVSPQTSSKQKCSLDIILGAAEASMQLLLPSDMRLTAVLLGWISTNRVHCLFLRNPLDYGNN